MVQNREQILEEIRIQGDLVRQFKAAKESKEKVSNFSIEMSNRSTQIQIDIIGKKT